MGGGGGGGDGLRTVEGVLQLASDHLTFLSLLLHHRRKLSWGYCSPRSHTWMRQELCSTYASQPATGYGEVFRHVRGHLIRAEMWNGPENHCAQEMVVRSIGGGALASFL